MSVRGGGSRAPADEEEDEVDQEVGTPQERLGRMYERKADLLQNLQYIDEQLAKLGYNVDSQAVKEAKKELKSGIRIDGQLSFRGKVLAEEYFKRLDEDNDGYLGWEDFRAMRSVGADFVPTLGGMVHDAEYLTWESWRMLIADMGIAVDKVGRVSLPAFIKYRTLVEKQKPLAVELQRAGVPMMPPALKLWADVKACIAEMKADIGLPLKLAEFENKGMLFDEVTYLLSNIGITFTRPEYYLCMAYRAQHENLMEALRRKFLKGAYASSEDAQYTPPLAAGFIPQHAIELTIDAIKYIKPDQLVAWLFSNRPDVEHKDGIYHRMLISKYRVHRNIRYYDRLCKLAFSIGYQLRVRRIFNDLLPVNKLPPMRATKSNFDIAINILGSGGNTETGMGFEWTCQKCEHPEQFLMNHKLPRESGFAVIVEFMLKPELDEEVAEHAAQELLHFVKSHFDAELKRNPQFRGLFCFPAVSEGDGAPVLRLALCYKRAISVDSWFETMLLPYSLNDLLCGFNGLLKTNISLSDIFNKEASFTLDMLLTARIELSAQFRTFQIVDILKRVKLALSASFTEHQAREGSEDANELYRRKLRESYPDIVRLFSEWERNIRGVKGTSFSFVFKKLSTMLEKLGSASHWFGQNFPPSIGNLPGYITSTYAAWAKGFLEEYMEIFQPLSDRMTNTLQQEEEGQEEEFRRERLGGKKDAKKSTVKSKGEQVLDKLKMLGIEMDADEVTAEDAHDPASLVQNAGERLVKSDMAAGVTFENIHSAVLGMHSIQILCGKFKLNCGTTGFDLMEAIPKPPSLKAVKKQCDDARANLKERALQRAREERQKRLKALEEEEDRKKKEERRRQREMAEKEMM